MKNLLKKTNFVLIIILIIGSFFRLYGINWDDKYFFHPDERNIGDAVQNLNYSGCLEAFFTYGTPGSKPLCDLNPNFFAYGTLPAYIARLFVGNNFEVTLILLRLISAASSIFSIYLVYWIVKELLKKVHKGKSWAMLAALLFSFNPGSIQFAHYGTFESVLTMLYLLVMFFALKFFIKPSFKSLLPILVVSGISISTKMTSAVILPVPLICFLVLVFREKRKWYIPFLKFGPYSLIVLFLSFFLSSPYILLDWNAFLGSMNYEGPVANGTLLVFYTQQFIGTIPFIYQITKILPYTVGLAIEVGSMVAIIAAVFLMIKSLIKKIWRNEVTFIAIITLSTILLGIFNMILYVKWTRYLTPLLPFLIIMFAYFGAKSFARFSRMKLVLWPILLISVFSSLLMGAVFFQRYLKPDARILLKEWASDNIQSGTYVLTEPFDLSAIALNEAHPGQIHDIDFYAVDDSSADFKTKFWKTVDGSDYIVLLSNRLYVTRFRLCDKFPVTCKFYRQLNDGTLGFEQVVNINRVTGVSYEKINLTTAATEPIPDETLNVFDNPTIIVYKRVK